MQAALGLARRGLGRVAPNPAVGCLLVRPDLGMRIVGRGWTQPGGRPHAETEALRQAGASASGATAYVTLEPCSHTGQTGPCADALINAGIKRAVVAMEDPDPRVSGRGIAKLQAANIDVTIGLLKTEAEFINTGFIYKIQSNRPLFSWKTATSLDGKIATNSGHSQWITGPRSRQTGHLLRARHDAILVGIGTALADNPDLTCRLPGLADVSPIRIIVDSHLRLPLTHRLVATAHQYPTWVYTTQTAPPHAVTGLEAAGVRIIRLSTNPSQKVDIQELAHRLAEAGMTRVLIEGGARLSTSFLKADLVDRVYWFRAPKLIGDDGLAAAQNLNISKIDETRAFTRRKTYDMGPDILEIFDRVRPAS